MEDHNDPSETVSENKERYVSSGRNTNAVRIMEQRSLN